MGSMFAYIHLPVQRSFPHFCQHFWHMYHLPLFKQIHVMCKIPPPSIY